MIYVASYMYLEKYDIMYFDFLFIIIVGISINPLFVEQILFQIKSFLKINGKHGLKSWIMTKMGS